VPAAYKIDKERRLVLTTVWGKLTFTDGVAHRNELRSDPDFDPTYREISDFTQVTELAFSAEELRGHAQFDVFSPSSRRAFVAPDDAKFGLGRMFAMLRESRGDLGIRVFRTLEEAEDWVFGTDE